MRKWNALVGISCLALILAACDLTDDQIQDAKDAVEPIEVVIVTPESDTTATATSTPTTIPDPTATPTEFPTEEPTEEPTATPTPTEPSTPTATPTQIAGTPIELGSMTLTSTYASLSIALAYSGDAEMNAVASVAYQELGATDWIEALPLHATGATMFGSVVKRDPGTTYTVRVTVDDPNGGGAVLVGDVSTVDESSEALIPTHTLCSSSCDYATLNDAFANAPAGAVVSVADGVYNAPTTARSTSISLIGDGDGVTIQPASTITAWTLETFTGPVTNQSYQVWHATSPIADPNVMQMESANGLPELVAGWARFSKESTTTGHTMQTPAGWAEVVHVNDMYRYGYATFGTDVYLRLPGDRDPNAYTARVNRVASFTTGRMVLNGSGSVVSGIDFNMFDVLIGATADGSVIADNRFTNAVIFSNANPGVVPNDYPTDVLIENNTLRATSLYTPALDQSAIGWKFIKGPMYIGGVKTSWSRAGSDLEWTAIGGRGGYQRLTARNNHIEGYFNAIGQQDAGFDSGAEIDYDVHGNTIKWIADDVFEPDGSGLNWRIWDNLVTQSSVAVSLGPGDFGPIYIWNNRFLDLTNDGVGADMTGDTTVQVLGFKYSGDSQPQLLAYVVNNVFESGDESAMGGYKAAGGSGSPERFYLRNNIFIMHRYVFSARENLPGEPMLWDEDYNAWYTDDPTRGLEYGGNNRKEMDIYREASGQGAHSLGWREVIELNADGTLPAGSPYIDAGVEVPMLADTFSGSAPDIGIGE